MCACEHDERTLLDATVENESEKVTHGSTGKPNLTTWPIEFRIEDGRRAAIRPLTEDDAEAVCRIFPETHAESDFLMYLPGEFDLTIEQEREWIRERIENENCLVLTVECDGRLVAFAGAESTKFRRARHQAELGITVVKECWGMGLGRRLTECIIAWATGQNLRKLYLRVFDDNERAIALYRSLGFIEEGRLREDMLRADGSYSDTIVMARHFAAM